MLSDKRSNWLWQSESDWRYTTRMWRRRQVVISIYGTVVPSVYMDCRLVYGRMRQFTEHRILESHKVDRIFLEGPLGSGHYELHSRMHFWPQSCAFSFSSKLGGTCLLSGNGGDILSLLPDAKHEINHRRGIPWRYWSSYVRPDFYLYQGALDVHQRLYGITNVQVYFYIRKYRRDRTMLKCVVAFLWYVKFCRR